MKRYDRIESENQDLKCPFQWAIFTDSFHNDKLHQSIIDDHIAELASSMPSASLSSYGNTKLNIRDSLITAVLESFPSSTEFSPHSESIQSTMQLADDLMLACDGGVDGEMLPKGTEDGKRGTAPPPHEGLTQRRVGGVMVGRQVESKGKVAETKVPAPAPVKRNPFVSAKDEFVREVGTLVGIRFLLYLILLAGWNAKLYCGV